ncbi:hypothetical protein N7494_007149 [Penicillium frequentans]|uniref:Uncharacterized protein n=1 Tax=Penicillium frequentans TaxID=3151616 RepID=A0AAD6GD78_9EURO|nr:hypothetical protein N7494_007149 [Penicillium glabrum]
MVDEEVNLYKYYAPSFMLVITVSKFTVMHTCKVIIIRQWFTYHYDRRPFSDLLAQARIRRPPYISQRILILLAPINFSAAVVHMS